MTSARFPSLIKSKSPSLLRTLLTGGFVLMMLAAAHLFMVAITAAENEISAPSPASGEIARMMNDRPMTEEIEAALRKTKSPEKREVLQRALATVKEGKSLELRALPVTRFLVWTSLGLTALGVLFIWATSRIKSDAVQSMVGIFGGNLLWTGGVEYGLTIGARSLGIGKSIGVVHGEPVALFGEYVLLKHTWGPLVLILAYLVFLESSRCPMFLWWRNKVPTMRGPIAAGRIDNFGPRSAFQYATTVWGFYLLLLWAYDEHVAGVYSLFTEALLGASLAGAVYLVWRLHQQTGWGPALRFAIGAVCVMWTPIEIGGKWGVFREPWLLLQPSTFTLFFGGLAVGTVLLLRAQRRLVVTVGTVSEMPLEIART